MKVVPTNINNLLVIEPTVHEDERGFFFESFNKKKFDAALGREIEFVQDNHSRSIKNVLRGLHYQTKRPQAKLVRVVAGTVTSVAVDLRRSSSTFGKHYALELSGENKRQFWIPEGFGHGFFTVSEYAELVYKTSDYYMVSGERCISWVDPELDLGWRHGNVTPILSAKDSAGTSFSDAELP